VTALVGPTIRAKRRPKPKMTPTLHEYVRRRDGVCVAFAFSHKHICANQWGVSHSPTNLAMLTLDHIWPDGQAKGLKPTNDKHNLVAMCWKANVAGPSHELREFEREWLRRVEP
jgi:hypothetical protein